jgi:hypothetical protein
MASTYPTGALGLVTVNAPPGDHTIAFRFEETPYRAVMDFISAVAFLGITGWLFLKQRRVFVALIFAIIFLGALVGLQSGPASAARPIAASADVGHTANLVGYSTERASDALHVTLHWFALNMPNRDYVAFVHLVDASGTVIAQNDSLTDWGVTPTSRWQPGELVDDRHALSLQNVPRGKYKLMAGMYLPKENGFENLAVYGRDGNKVGNEVELGDVEIQN